MFIRISYTVLLLDIGREIGMVLDATPITGNLDTVKVLNLLVYGHAKFLSI